MTNRKPPMITIHSYAPLCFGGPVIFIVSLEEGGVVGSFFFFFGGGDHMVFRRNEERLSYHLKNSKGRPWKIDCQLTANEESV